ncbi:ABC transporter ATP-binding protein [Oligoflexus tunisiensis]|uniref:ABC transporter ATP-binding protein n=1 Tax=Oligoflexus tunisiensis TaxID=708132 RepID=UPI000B144CAC|nr:ABC transporter ATP-binding protein [Oligoflexus tunisiensis]
MLICKKLSKNYGSFQAVKDLTLTVERGEIFGFLGPNGAGKTSTIKMLMGLLVPSSGSASIDGLDTQRHHVAVKSRVGYLPDHPHFLDYLRGRELLCFVGEMHGLAPSEARARTQHWLQNLGLEEAQDDFASQYSTGMKKRLGLACALIHEPKVLILDEPTNGLDPRSAAHVRDLILDFAARGRTVLLSTHLLDLAERLCHRLGILHHGQLVALGSCAELAPEGSLEEKFLALTADRL